MLFDGRLAPLAALDPETDLENSTFRLVLQGRDYVGEAWSLGRLDHLVAQLAAAVERLDRGEPALVRSAVTEQLDVPWYLFEPSGDRVVISAFLLPDRSLANDFPIPLDGFGGGPTVYDHVLAHREALLAPGGTDLFREVPFPREPLLAAMRREVAGARHLLPPW